MKQLFLFLPFSTLVPVASAQNIKRDIPYAAVGDQKRTLDVYAPSPRRGIDDFVLFAVDFEFAFPVGDAADEVEGAAGPADVDQTGDGVAAERDGDVDLRS